MTYLVTFHSHFDAILVNRTLKSAGVDVRLMPVPRSLSSSCGTCVEKCPRKVLVDIHEDGKVVPVAQAGA